MLRSSRQTETSLPTLDDDFNQDTPKPSNRKHVGAIIAACFLAIFAMAQISKSALLPHSGIDSRKASVRDAMAKRRANKTKNSQQDMIHPSFAGIKTFEPAYAFDPDADDYDEYDLSKLNIRKWGCERRDEAPLIFVHIGKAGGGSVRARIAASAMDYNRDRWMNYLQDKTYYYPMKEKIILPRQQNITSPDGYSAAHTTIQRGILVNSKFNNFRPSYPRTNDNFTTADMTRADTKWKTFEKTLPCNASTPLGQAIACPLVRLGKGTAPSCKGSRCNVVYTGHNLLGNELHWLPTEYLARWWYTTPWAVNGDVTNLWEERAQRWGRPNGPKSKCRYNNEDDTMSFYRTHYHDCVAPREEAIDLVANDRLLPAVGAEGGSMVDDWSPIYASLPILRVTMMREPFTWLVSKFFWHQGLHGFLVGIDGKRKALRTCDNNGTDYPDIAEWVSAAVLKQLNHLCGEDCLVRMNAGLMSLDQLEQQARHNLQHSFAVVGLLHETQSFYEMITARAAYMNTTLNPEVTGSRHSTSQKEEYQRCSKVYETQEFQENLLKVCPELQALKRVYEVAVEVNRAQKQEMQSCGLLPPTPSAVLSEYLS